MRIYFLIVIIASMWSAGQVLGQLSVTLTIGAGGVYPNLTAAVDDLSSIRDDWIVTFNIKDGTYNEQISIVNLAGTNPVTFQAESGNAADVILSFSASSDSNNYIVEISDTGYIIFNQLTFAPLGTTYGRAISLINCANEITVSNCNFVGQPTTSTTRDHALIYDRSNEPGRTLINNTFTNGSHAISVLPQTSLPGAIVRNNTFTNQYARTIEIFGHESVIVDGNTITTSSSNPSFVGINIENASDDYSIINNSVLFNNGQGMYIAFGSSSAGEVALIANNFVASTGNPTNLISLEGNEYIDFYHNTAYNGGNSNSCLLICEGQNHNVINNIFIQTHSGGAVYEVADDNSVTVSEHNNFDTPGDVALWNYSTYASLTDLRNAFSVDLNSSDVSVTVVDAANGDLHLSGVSLGDQNLIGASSIGILDDIDGDTRDPLFPYMGADEGSIALPVELVSFSADVIDEGVTLDWITATETNNFGFEVEKKSEVSDWSKIGFVTGAGTTTEPQHYHFSDHKVEAGIYLYRLKQIDTDGAFSFSNEITIAVNTPISFELSQNYPNPFNPQTSIGYQLAQAGKVELTIYNARGETVRKLVNENKPSGSYSAPWDGSNDSQQIVVSGTYFYTLKVDGTIVASKSMILVK